MLHNVFCYIIDTDSILAVLVQSTLIFPQDTIDAAIVDTDDVRIEAPLEKKEGAAAAAAAAAAASTAAAATAGQ